MAGIRHFRSGALKETECTPDIMKVTRRAQTGSLAVQRQEPTMTQPAETDPDSYPDCGCQPDDCPDREGVERETGEVSEHPAETDPLRELVESGMTYAEAEAVHGSDCMCPWCAPERMTYCALTSGLPDHPDHWLPSCPTSAITSAVTAEREAGR